MEAVTEPEPGPETGPETQTQIQVDEISPIVDVCVNCSQSFPHNTKRSEEGIDNDDLNPQKISKSLSTIYKLNYLSAFLDPSISTTTSTTSTTTTIESELQNQEIISTAVVYNISGKLCDDCLEIYKSLYKFYDSFNQLRSLESSLAVEIKKLDDCIEAHKFIRQINIKQEPVFLQQAEEDEEPYALLIPKKKSSQSQKQTPRPKSTPRKPKPKQNVKNSSNIPSVVVRRLEDDSTATGTGKRKRKINQSLNEDILSTYELDDNYFSPQNDENVNNNVNNNDNKSDEEEDSDFSADENENSQEESDSQETDEEDIKMELREEDEEEEEIAPVRGKKVVAPKPKITKPSKPRKRVNKSSCGEKSDEPAPVKKKRGRKPKYPEGEGNDGEGKRRRRKRAPDSDERKARAKIDLAYRKRKTKSTNPCWSCDLDFDSAKACLEHTMNEHFQPGNFICETCSRISTQKISHSFHVSVQCGLLKPGQLLPTYTCEKCPVGKFQCYFKKQLRTHMSKVHHEGRVPCPIEGCTLTSKNPASLRVHVKLQHREEEEPLELRTCYDCEPNRVYTNKYSLTTHRTTHHTEEGLRKYKEKQQEILQKSREKRKAKSPKFQTVCTECDLDLFTHMGLVHHRKNVHGSNYAHVCDTCGSTFSASTALRYHQKHTHSDLRSFFCDSCGKGFKTSSHLNEHILHTHDEQGRLEYNARMRVKNQRRKARDLALARKQAEAAGQIHGSNFSSSIGHGIGTGAGTGSLNQPHLHFMDSNSNDPQNFTLT